MVVYQRTRNFTLLNAPYAFDNLVRASSTQVVANGLPFTEVFRYTVPSGKIAFLEHFYMVCGSGGVVGSAVGLLEYVGINPSVVSEVYNNNTQVNQVIRNSNLMMNSGHLIRYMVANNSGVNLNMGCSIFIREMIV